MRVYLFLLIHVLSSQVFAQQDPVPTFNMRSHRIITRWGILVGANVIRPRFEELVTDILAFKLGFNGGIAFEHTFTSRVTLSLNVMYEDKGYKFDVRQVNNDYNPPADQRSILDFTFNYATASIIPKYSLDAKHNLYIGLGPYFGYLFSEAMVLETYINGDLIQKVSTKNQLPYENYKKWDAGLTSSVGYRIQVKPRLAVSIQFLYNLGLMNVSQPNTTPMKNSTYSLLLGLHHDKASPSH